MIIFAQNKNHTYNTLLKHLARLKISLLCSGKANTYFSLTTVILCTLLYVFYDWVFFINVHNSKVQKKMVFLHYGTTLSLMLMSKVPLFIMVVKKSFFSWRLNKCLYYRRYNKLFNSEKTTRFCCMIAYLLNIVGTRIYFVNILY